MNVCLCTLCGPPSSGKTFLAKLLRKHCPDGFKAVHICFDSIEKQFGQKGAAEWCAETAEIWKKSRQRSLGLIEQALGESAASLQRTVILVDDTNHLQSMRWQHFRSARKCGASYIQLVLHCPRELIAERQALREDAVPESVLEKIISAFESADWEAEYSKRIDGATPARDVWKMLVASFETPAPPIPEATEEELEAKVKKSGDAGFISPQRRAREATATSKLHQIDLVLRKQVTDFFRGESAADSFLPRAVGDLKRRWFAALQAYFNGGAVAAFLEPYLETWGALDSQKALLDSIATEFHSALLALTDP